jgi:hypothetical protein
MEEGITVVAMLRGALALPGVSSRFFKPPSTVANDKGSVDVRDSTGTSAVSSSVTTTATDCITTRGSGVTMYLANDVGDGDWWQYLGQYLLDEAGLGQH